VILDHLLFVFRIEPVLRVTASSSRRIAADPSAAKRAPPAISVVGLRLIGLISLIAPAGRRIAEQEFDEAAAILERSAEAIRTGAGGAGSRA
jgi:hypothetical protein